MTAPHKVWLIDEGHAGHRVQSEGILNALGAQGVSTEATKIACRPTLRGILRPPARALFERMRGERALRFAHRVAEFAVPDAETPQFIISSGGRTAFVSRALSLATGAPNVFVGNPKPFPADWFSVVMSPVPLANTQAIITGVVPNIVTPSECREKAAAYWQGAVPERCWTLLIGGASRNHLYDAGDWRNIAEGVNRLAERHGIKWLISTSRRTGAEAERILESTISPDAIEEFVVYSREPKRIVLPFLGTGKVVFVTQDSLTMLSEAISSGRTVVSLLPRRIELAPDNFMSVVLRKYRSWRQFVPLACADMAEFAPPQGADEFHHEAEDELRQAAVQLKDALDL